MDDEGVVEEIVNKFLLNTCRLRSQISDDTAIQAAGQRAFMAARRPPFEPGAHVIPLTTGSAAEFYIEPMLPHVSDIDVMVQSSAQLAIPRGQSPPTQLPAEFSNYVKVFEIIDSDFPGYVYLELRYLLTECIDESKYTAVETDRRLYLHNNRFYRVVDGDIHGPALSTTVLCWDCFGAAAAAGRLRISAV